ncbi:hypothetical protein RHS01_06614 [Rhizoctonia solani]|uniref:Uncharacterized protein n=1 Tax=Rhizoctonia solani TaxID=456999 RepID=A0A8H7M0K3_9AGAM|nr:hypothetical protein RHS01_06614 [Rhizoctonia solani]
MAPNYFINAKLGNHEQGVFSPSIVKQHIFFRKYSRQPNHSLFFSINVQVSVSLWEIPGDAISAASDWGFILSHGLCRLSSPSRNGNSPSPSPLRTNGQPKVILTSETSDSATTPASPGSLHRQSSIGTSMEDFPRKASLPDAQRQLFADQLSQSKENGGSVPEDMQTPRAGGSPPREAPEHTSTPKANGLKSSPSSDLKNKPQPPQPLLDSPVIRKQPSASSLTAPQQTSRSRRGSAASVSSDVPQMATFNPPINPPLVESPTSEKQPLYASPRSSIDGPRSPHAPLENRKRARQDGVQSVEAQAVQVE